MVYFGLILWVPILCSAFCAQIKVAKMSVVQDQVSSSHPPMRLLWHCDPHSSSKHVNMWTWEKLNMCPQKVHTQMHTNSHKEEHREHLISAHSTHTNMNSTVTTLPSSSPPNWAWRCYRNGHSRDFSSNWTKTDFGTAGLEVPVLSWGFYSQTPGGSSLAPDLPSCSQPAWLAAHHLYVLAHNVSSLAQEKASGFRNKTGWVVVKGSARQTSCPADSLPISLSHLFSHSFLLLGPSWSPPSAAFAPAKPSIFAHCHIFSASVSHNNPWASSGRNPSSFQGIPEKVFFGWLTQLGWIPD